MKEKEIELSTDQMNRILAQANKIPFLDILPVLIYEILRAETQMNGINVPFIIAPLLAAIGVLLHRSTVQAFNSSKSGICMYTALIAQPSTGKSPANDIVKGAMYKIEQYHGTPPEKSMFTNSASVEGLLSHLNNIPCMVAFYDESSTFSGALGRYGNSSGSSSYDRSIYLTLFTAPEFIDRDVKQQRMKVIKPRFSMVLMGHPFYYIPNLKNERFSYDDGLLQRFLMMAPLPPYMTAEEMSEISTPIISLHCIFYYMYVVHFDQERNYTFTSKDTLKQVFNVCRIRTQALNNFDSFLAAMIGKSIGQIIRIAVCLQSFFVACTKTEGMVDSREPQLTANFVNTCQNLANNSLPGDFIISEDVVIRAKKLVDYFNMNKLILSTYDVNPVMAFDDCIQFIITSKSIAPVILPAYQALPPKVFRNMRRAFEVNTNIFSAATLSSNNLYSQEGKMVFQKLEELNLGKRYMFDADNFHKVPCFRRINSIELKSKPELGMVIQDFGLNLEDVISVLEETESREGLVPKTWQPKMIRKRDRSNDDDSDLSTQPPKRFKQNTQQILKTRNDNGCPYVVAVDSNPFNNNRNKKKATPVDRFQIQRYNNKDDEYEFHSEIESNFEENETSNPPELDTHSLITNGSRASKQNVTKTSGNDEISYSPQSLSEHETIIEDEEVESINVNKAKPVNLAHSSKNKKQNDHDSSLAQTDTEELVSKKQVKGNSKTSKFSNKNSKHSGEIKSVTNQSNSKKNVILKSESESDSQSCDESTPIITKEKIKSKKQKDSKKKPNVSSIVSKSIINSSHDSFIPSNQEAKKSRITTSPFQSSESELESNEQQFKKASKTAKTSLGSTNSTTEKKRGRPPKNKASQQTKTTTHPSPSTHLMTTRKQRLESESENDIVQNKRDLKTARTKSLTLNKNQTLHKNTYNF